jgi:hypothetical protein
MNYVINLCSSYNLQFIPDSKNSISLTILVEEISEKLQQFLRNKNKPTSAKG